jgi:hypothetical protein
MIEIKFSKEDHEFIESVAKRVFISLVIIFGLIGIGVIYLIHAG